MDDPAKTWLVLGLIIGILMSWFGFIIALVSYPLATGQVRSRDYNYRPFKQFTRRWTGVTDDISDEVNRKAAAWGVVLGILMALMGICAAVFGIFSIGNPMIFYIVIITLFVLFTLGVSIYAFVRVKKNNLSP
jgi:uncharacterized membrane protein YedE/YeeE